MKLLTNNPVAGLVYTYMPLGALPIGCEILFQAFSNSILVKEESPKCSGEEEVVGYKIQNLEKVNLNKLTPSEITIINEVILKLC